MKRHYLFIILSLLWVGCTQKYGYLRKLPVNHPVQQETRYKRIGSTIRKEPPQFILDSVVAKDTLHEQLLQSNSHPAKKRYSKASGFKSKNLPHTIFKQSVRSLQDPVVLPKEQPDDDWNSEAISAFWWMTLLLISVPLVLIFPPVIIFSSIVAMITMSHGGKALEELKVKPQKGKGLAIIAMIIGVSTILFAVILALTIFVYLLAPNLYWV